MRAIEHYYAIVLYADVVEHESRPFDSYDEAARAAWDEVDGRVRGNSYGARAESYRVEKRWDVVYD